MATIRYEFITLGRGGWAGNVIKDVLAAGTLEVTTVATPENDRPTAPLNMPDGTLYLRSTPIGGPVHLVRGYDSASEKVTATLTNGLRLVEASPEVVSIRSGERVSFIGES